MLTAGGKDLVNPDPTAPYVGRPIMLSDLCSGGEVLDSGIAPYVWLGADLPIGSDDLGGGFVRETVEVSAPR